MKKYSQKLIGIFLSGVMMIHAPLTVFASDMDVFTDVVEEIPDNETQQEIFNSGDEETKEDKTVQERFEDGIEETDVLEEIGSESENFEEPSEIDDTLEIPAGSTADLIIGNYECAINGNNITIIKYSGTDESVVVPSSLGGYEVTAIGALAFANCTHLKK